MSRDKRFLVRKQCQIEMLETLSGIMVEASRKIHLQMSLDEARTLDGRHGGWRPGAERRRGRTTVPHDARPMHVARNPWHHDTTTRFDRNWIAPHSSAPWFDGWAEPIRGDVWKRELVAQTTPTVCAKTWLLSVGWRRHGAL